MRVNRINFSILMAGLLLVVTACGGPESEDEIQQRISRSEALARVDSLCFDLPKPANFKFVYRNLTGNGHTTSISYQFSSSLPISEVDRFYSNVLPTLGWHFSKESRRYEKGNQQLSITKVDFPKADYSVYCGEEH